MFGVVPKSLWSKRYPADENNLCTWAMRLLLIEHNDRVILIDNGMGNKQSDKFFSYYDPHGPNLLESLQEKGFRPEDITDNFLTHLHFDHCGGGVKWNSDRTGYELTFPNATYWSHKEHWQHALNPNARERASFLKENLLPMEENGHLKLLEDTEGEFTEGFRFLTINGHTTMQMLPLLDYKGRKLLYCADLLPSPVHVPTAWVMGYDIRPLDSMEEKARILKQAADEHWVLFFEHDHETECCTVKNTEKGVRVDQVFKLEELQ